MFDFLPDASDRRPVVIDVRPEAAADDSAGWDVAPPLKRWRAVYESSAGLTGTETAILAYVAFRDGSARGCTVTVSRMSRETRFDAKAIRRALRALARKGRIDAEPRSGKPTVYRVRPVDNSK